MAKKTHEKKASGGSLVGVIAAGIVLLATIVLVGVVFQNFQSQLNSEVADINSESKKTQTELMVQIESLKEELLKSDEDKAMEISKRVKRLELAAKANCSTYDDDWDTFVDTDLQWSFCYKKDWGQLVRAVDETSIECREGSRDRISFESPDSPTINYSNKGYKIKCDTDKPVFCWSCLEGDKTEEELLEALGFLDTRKNGIEKISVIDGASAYVLDAELEDLDGEVYQTIGYYIPRTLLAGEYNLEVVGNGGEKDIELLVESIYVN
jgi:hypothetical protein